MMNIFLLYTKTTHTKINISIEKLSKTQLTDTILHSEEIERKMALHSLLGCSMDILLPAFQSLENVT